MCLPTANICFAVSDCRMAPMHKTPTSCCSSALLVSTCCAHFAYFKYHTSHSVVIATGLRDADRVHWGLEGRPKAESVPLLHHHFHVLGSPIQNLMLLKSPTIKCAQFLFSYVEASYELYKNLHHSKIFCYTVSNTLDPPPASGTCRPPPLLLAYMTSFSHVVGLK